MSALALAFAAAIVTFQPFTDAGSGQDGLDAAIAGSAPTGSLRVKLIGPARGATVSGRVPLSARVTGGRASRVEFRIDGRLRWSERYRPYRYGSGTLNTTSLANGVRIIGVRAIGPRGAVAKDTLAIDVANRSSGGSPPGGSKPVPAPSGGGGPVLPAAGGAEAYPYDPQALFNRPIPAGAALDPRSDSVIAEVAGNLRSQKFGFVSEGETPPVYEVGPGDPFYDVRVDGRLERFRVPVGATVGGGADHPLILLDPNHPEHGRNVELRLWQASINHGARTLSSRGQGLFHYNNDGARLNPDASISQSRPFRGGGTGSGLSYLAGLIRPEEVRAGEIRHALRFAYACNDSSDRFRAPATRTDQPHAGCNGDPSATPAARKMDMGMRLQLDPAVDCEARTVPMQPGSVAGSPAETRFLRIVCRALQTYGMIMMDGTSADGLGIYLEGEPTARWSEEIGSQRFGSYGWIGRDAATPDDGLARDANSGIPWHRMRVVGPFS